MTTTELHNIRVSGPFYEIMKDADRYEVSYRGVTKNFFVNSEERMNASPAALKALIHGRIREKVGEIMQETELQA